MVSIAICLAWLVIAAEVSSETPKVASTASAPKSAWIKHWSQHWSERESVYLDWQVVRDSRRDGNFGFRPSSTPAKGQLWLGAEQGRINLSSLAVRGVDGDYHPQDRTTVENRLEFRHALLEQRLAGPKRIPEWKPISLTLTPTELLPDFRWGSMVQLSALAPVLAAAPSFALDHAEIELSTRTAHFAGRKLPVLIVKRPASESWELWVDPASNFRIVRCLCRGPDQMLGQIDFAYDDEPPGLPLSWTVLEFDKAGYVIDFLSAEVGSVQYGLDVPDQTLAAAPLDGGLNPRRLLQAESIKNAVRWMMDRPLIPSAILCLLALLAAAKKNRKGRGIAVVLLAMAIGVVCVRNLPVLDTPLRPIYSELSVIAEQARDELLVPSGEQSKARLYSPERKKRLESLSDTLSRSYQIRLDGGSWSRGVGQNDDDQKARFELLQIAQNDLPSLLENDLNSATRLKLITERLQRVDQYLAEDGQSSP